MANGMLCPRCQISLSTMNLVGRPSSHCHSCEATWLQGQDLEQRLGEDPSSAGLLQELRDLRRKGLPAGRLRCPHCAAMLAGIDASGTHIDYCCSCGGALFNFDVVCSAVSTQRTAIQPVHEVTPEGAIAYVAGDIIINAIAAFCLLS